MGTVNRTVSYSGPVTHEGGRAAIIGYEAQLRRSLMSCMLWEDTFYESGVEIAERIKELVGKVPGEKAAALAIEARNRMKLRHAPLWVANALAELRWKGLADLLPEIIQRADEPAEFLAMYWKGGRHPLSKQVKKGLARAFGKFNAYQLAKYNRDNPVKLRDVLFLTHPRPKDDEQQAVWNKLVNGTLETPDTWEVLLSAGADKRETFTRLIAEKKLGALALLRNLRNMEQSGVDDTIVRQAILDMKPDKVLPFRFVAAARYAPRFEGELEQAMFKCLAEHPKLPGRTFLVVDVSGSMDATLSVKSELTRIEAAGALAMLLREISNTTVYTFSDKAVLVPPRRGFALQQAINESQAHRGTYLFEALKVIIKHEKITAEDLLIVITDEQAHDSGYVSGGRRYMINVVAYQNGVGYGEWTHIDGWSEAAIDYIIEYEKNSGKAK